MIKNFTLTRITFLSVLITGIYVVYASVSGVTNNGGPGAGYTNAPSESHCATSGCHTTYSLNRTPSNLSNMNLSTTFTGGGYIPDSTYTLTLSYSQGGISTYGFSITCLSKTGNNPAGTFTSGTGSQSTNTSIGGKTRYYLTHTSGTNPGSWTFKWTAPSIPMDSVVFYAIVNATNGNGQSSGDEVYAKEFQFGMSSLLPQPSATTSKPKVCVGDTITYYGSATGASAYKWRFQSGSPQIVNQATVIRSFSVAGNYRDTFWASNSYGLSKPVVIQMQVLARPSAVITGISPNDTVCQGDTVTLTCNTVAGAKYLWNTGVAKDTTTSIKVTKSGRYSVTITNSSGCTNTAVADSIVIRQPAAVTLNDFSANPVCEGDSIYLTVNPGYKKYDFYIHNVLTQTSATKNSLTLKSPGNYAIYAIVNDGYCNIMSNTLMKDIEDKLPAPNINCGTPSTSSVTFVWNNIPGGNGSFMISLDSGKTWKSNGTDTTYTINGLNFNTKRMLYVKGQKNGACPDGEAAFLVCTSLPCSNFTYKVNKADSLVCLGNSVNITVNNLVLPKYSISFNGGAYVKDTVFAFQPVNANGDFNLNIVDSAATNCPALFYEDSVIVDTPAAMQYVLSDSIICKGEKVALGISSDYFSYTFFKNNTQIATGTNDIQLFDNLVNGDKIKGVGKNLRCEKNTPEFTITVNTPVTPGFTSTGTNRAFTFTDTTSNVASRTWNLGDNSAVQTTQVVNYTYAANGNYDVKLTTTDNNGCNDSATQQVTATNVGVFLINGANITMYPNPASTELILNSPQLADGISVRITDINGRLVLTKTLAGNFTSINVSDLAAGIYVVHLDHNGNSASQKLVIRR